MALDIQQHSYHGQFSVTAQGKHLMGCATGKDSSLRTLCSLSHIAYQWFLHDKDLQSFPTLPYMLLLHKNP
jgi:hypothetical protein